MKFTIDEKVCQKHNMTMPEVLAVLAVRQSKNYEEMMENLFNKEVLVQHSDNTLVTQRWNDVVDEILCDSSGGESLEKRDLDSLSLKIMECFPKQKMKDRFGRETPYYYRCNKNEVRNKLKKFFVKFGNEYTDEEIIDATKRYVAYYSKQGFSGMRLAKYFIWKDITKQGEEEDYIERVSDLLTWLENKESESEGGVEVNTSDDWMMSVRN